MLLNRIRTMLWIYVLLFLCLIARFIFIHVYMGKGLAKAATAQRITTEDISKPRGDIEDRNGIPLTNRRIKSMLVLKPLLLRDKMDEVEKICGILGLGTNKITREIEIKKEPILLEVDETQKKAVLDLCIQGVSAVNLLERYDESTVARHVIGYLNKIDQIGEAGIEKFYEDQLRVDAESSVGVVTDAKDNVLEGLGYRFISGNNSGKKNNIKLTIDYHIQKIVENVMDNRKLKGAVVIEDVSTGDILAMASKPDFEQNNVGAYLDSTENELFNRAVASYNLGSIFKIIDVAAYLESGIKMDEHYYCTGLLQIGEKEYRCFDGISHGLIDLTQAFAQSCNAYFIKMGIKLGSKSLLDMARRFGIGSATGVNEQGIAESSGNLPARKYYTDGEIANLSIGQGDIMSTPLQIADIAAIIANGGIKNKISIVDAIIDEKGEETDKIKVSGAKRIIEREIALKIKALMDEATISGTAKKANLEEYGGAGGKTGSAETGQYLNGEKIVHAWFAGYFPREYPRYSVAVFIENGKSGGEAAVPVFAEIAEEIIKLGY